MRIHDLMNRDVVSCTPPAHLDDVVALMWNKNCSLIPVVEAGVVVGVVTDRDVALCAWRRGLSLSQLRVAEAMSDRPVVVVEEETMEHAEELMRSHNVYRLPVVDTAKRLVGIISLGDLARAPRRGAASSHRDDVVATLSALARRRSAEHAGR